MRIFAFFPVAQFFMRNAKRAMARGAFVLSVILGLVPLSSNAGTGVSLPGATTQDDIEVFDSLGNLLGDFGCGDTPGCTGLSSFSNDGASATVGGTPPFSESSGSSTSDSLFVNSTLTYSVEVVGPGQTVSLDFRAMANGSSSGDRFAYADTVESFGSPTGVTRFSARPAPSRFIVCRWAAPLSIMVRSKAQFWLRSARPSAWF